MRAFGQLEQLVSSLSCCFVITVCDFVRRSFYSETYFKSKVNVLIQFVESYCDEAVINSWIE